MNELNTWVDTWKIICGWHTVQIWLISAVIILVIVTIILFIILYKIPPRISLFIYYLFTLFLNYIVHSESSLIYYDMPRALQCIWPIVSAFRLIVELFNWMNVSVKEVLKEEGRGFSWSLHVVAVHFAGKAGVEERELCPRRVLICSAR